MTNSSSNSVLPRANDGDNTTMLRCTSRPGSLKLFGRAFYESLGSPKLILAPMVDQSEFVRQIYSVALVLIHDRFANTLNSKAWRMLTRSFLSPEASKKFLAYTPMLHARLFVEKEKYRRSHFEPIKASVPFTHQALYGGQVSKSDLFLDGNPSIDRPLFVQFCANSPDDLLKAAQLVQPFCDAVDLNLGCPQAIARRGHYGAYLQEDWDLIYRLINRLHEELDIPVTAKIRVLETREKTLEYAKMVLSAGASILTVHGRQRHQKGHNTGLADWGVIRYLRDNLPSETVLFANGNILRNEDIAECLRQTGADGVMSAEGNLADPSIFASPPAAASSGREFWQGRNGESGYRVDAVFRRYMDIIYTYALDRAPPKRKTLFLPTDLTEVDKELMTLAHQPEEYSPSQNDDTPSNNTKREKSQRATSPNLTAIQAHLFNMLRPLLTKHTNIRDALARCRAGDISSTENVLQMVEEAVKQGLIDYQNSLSQENLDSSTKAPEGLVGTRINKDDVPITAAELCKQPWWICQPYVRPLPTEALEKGSLTLSKKEKAKLQENDLQGTVVFVQPEHTVQVHASTGGDDQDVKVNQEALVYG